MTYNLPLLRKERDWVAEQRALPWAESELAMDYWYVDTSQTTDLMGKTCGTTYCVAGHIAATTPGVKWRSSSILIEVDGQECDVSKWAREQLGLDYEEASDLWYASDSEVLDVLDDLIARAEAEERNNAE